MPPGSAGQVGRAYDARVPYAVKGRVTGPSTQGFSASVSTLGLLLFPQSGHDRSPRRKYFSAVLGFKFTVTPIWPFPFPHIGIGAPPLPAARRHTAANAKTRNLVVNKSDNATVQNKTSNRERPLCRSSTTHRNECAYSGRLTLWDQCRIRG